MRTTLAVRTGQDTDIRPAPTGSTSSGMAAPVSADQRGGAPSPVSSRPVASAERRRQRDAELLLVVRRAQQSRALRARGTRRPEAGGSDEVGRPPNALAENGDRACTADPPDRPEFSGPGGRPPAVTSQDGGSNGGRRDWRLPTIDLSVTILRRQLTHFLRLTDLTDDERYDLLLAACEAASNAIEHAQDPTEPFFDVATRIDEAGVTVVVRDFGRWTDGPSGPDRGRGMAMMRALADSTVVPGPHGTTVTIRSSPRQGHPPVA